MSSRRRIGKKKESEKEKDAMQCISIVDLVHHVDLPAKGGKGKDAVLILATMASE